MYLKRGQSLSINAIIILILALIVLIVVVLIIVGPSSEFLDTIREQLGISKKLLNETNVK